MTGDHSISSNQNGQIMVVHCNSRLFLFRKCQQYTFGLTFGASCNSRLPLYLKVTSQYRQWELAGWTAGSGGTDWTDVSIQTGWCRGPLVYTEHKYVNSQPLDSLQSNALHVCVTLGEETSKWGLSGWGMLPRLDWACRTTRGWHGWEKKTRLITLTLTHLQGKLCLPQQGGQPTGDRKSVV